MYLVIWENRHPYNYKVSQHWEKFDSQSAAQKRLDGLNTEDFVKTAEMHNIGEQNEKLHNLHTDNIK